MAKKEEALTFEQSMEKLETIVRRLEEGKVDLDEAINLYKEGLELSKWCNEKLNKAEEQITTIMTDEGEKPYSVEGEA